MSFKDFIIKFLNLTSNDNAPKLIITHEDAELGNVNNILWQTISKQDLNLDLDLELGLPLEQYINNSYKVK